MECSERNFMKADPNTTSSDPFAFMKILFWILLSVSLLFLLTGCEFFMTPQERSGVNPKPFNSQAGWEYTQYGSFRN